MLPHVPSLELDAVDELQDAVETEQEARGSGDEEESMETSPDEMLDPPSSDLPCKRNASSSFLFRRHLNSSAKKNKENNRREWEEDIIVTKHQLFQDE